MILINDPGLWQHYVKRADNIGLPLEKVKSKYLSESIQYNEFIISQARLNAIAQGTGGFTSTSTSDIIGDGTGTILFNGTNAYVRVPNATLTTWLPGTDDFTVEFFLKRTGSGTGFPRVFSIGPDTSATLGLSIESGTAYVWADGGTGEGQWMNGAMPASYNNGTAWCHVAISRISGSTRLYINGEYKSKATDIRSINGTIHPGEPMYMGGDGATNWFQGKLTNFRWANVGLYAGSETTITVPTAPLANIAQTKLLLLGGGVSNPVYDATQINNLVNSGAIWNSDTPF